MQLSVRLKPLRVQGRREALTSTDGRSRAAVDNEVLSAQSVTVVTNAMTITLSPPLRLWSMHQGTRREPGVRTEADRVNRIGGP